MKNTKHIIKLSSHERRQLNDIIHKGTHKARVILRAHALLMSHAGMSKDRCAEQLHTGRNLIQRARDRFRAKGLEHALTEEPRSGQPKKLDEKAEQYLTALACTNPPEGADHWTLELLTKRMITDKKVKTISSVCIMNYLHANDLKPWREKNVVHTTNHT